jgi:hypothetical protein
MRISRAPGRQSPGSRRISKPVGMAILLAAAAISLAIGFADLRESEQLLTGGVVTKARLSRKHVERSRSWKHHYIDIEYRTATGQVIRARDDVASALFQRVKVGDTISVRYLPAEPDVHALGATGRRDTFMLWMAGLLFALTGVYLIFGS